MYKNAMIHAPVNKQQPHHSCGPKKSPLVCFPSDPGLFNKAPAIGDPISEAKEEMPHDMPVLVPRRVGSGQRLGNTAAGSVTSPAEQKPQNTLKTISPFWVDTAIQHSDSMPETEAQQNQVRRGPRCWAMIPAERRPKNEAAIPMTRMYNAKLLDIPSTSCANDGM